MKFLFENHGYSSSVMVVFFLMVARLFPLNNAVPSIKLPRNEKAEAVFVFGDSIVDTGNNNNILTTAKCNYPPYGRDFMGGKPTGRFSNGRVPSDFIAEAFGVKKFLPAYLDPDLQLQDLLTGVSFASGGCGYDPVTSTLAPAFSLSDQLDQFKDYIKRIDSAVGEARRAKIVSKSVFVICTGTNDILNTYYSTALRRFHYTIDSYTDFLVSCASSFIQELHGLGARIFLVLGLPPVGCVPSQRTIHGGLHRKCADYANQAAILFNSKLLSSIHSLNSTLSHAFATYLDVYNPLLFLIHNPAKYGFQEATKGCCGTGKIEVTYLCYHLDYPLTCKDDSKYVFWDSFHPTQRAYETLITIVLKSVNYLFG